MLALARLVLAGLFAIACAFAMGAALLAVGAPEWLVSPLVILTFFGSMSVVSSFFNIPLRPGPASVEGEIVTLEAEGRLVRQRFRALRAFEVEEFEDEGLHYYVELADGRVLFLTGQYLYDYEPVTDDPGSNQPRQFPCTEFEILRHKEEGYVLEIRCAGSVLEPEAIAAPFSVEELKQGIPEDGEVIADRSYEFLKHERAAALASR